MHILEVYLKFTAIQFSKYEKRNKMAVSVVYIHWPERGPRILEYE